MRNYWRLRRSTRNRFPDCFKQSSLDPARLDRLLEPYLDRAREEVERESDETEAAEYGFDEGGCYE